MINNLSALSANQISRDQSDKMTSPIRQGDSKVGRDFRKNIEKQMSISDSQKEKIEKVGRSNSQNVMEEIEDSSKEVNPELQNRLNPSVDQLTRRLAMQGFLKKMEEDVGVDAGQIVTAFSQLSANDLLAPPEASVEKIVDQLGLDSSDRGRAIGLFQNLLQQTSPSNVGEYLKGNDRQVSLEVISADEARKKALNASLDRMSQAFFVDNQMVREDQKAKNDEMIGPMGDQKGVASEFDSGISSAASLSTSNGLFSTSASESGQIIPQGFTSSTGGELSTSQNTSSGVRSRGFETLGGENQSIEATATEFDRLKSEVAADGQSEFGANADNLSDAEILPIRNETSVYSPSSEVDQAMAFPVSLSSMGQEESQEEFFESQDLEGILDQADTRFTGPEWGSRRSEKNDLPANSISQSRVESQKEGKGEFQGEQQLSDQMSGLANAQKNEGAKGNQFLVQMPKMSSAQESSNVRDVVDQAQVLVKNGGGEMKIKLNPEGVGEVTLKVISDGGRVNIEMIASNANTKKLLENGLADLRETFSSHRINVDQIKIGSPDSVSKHMDQNMQDQNQSQSHVRQFLEEFRQNNQNWRQGFVDMPAMKNYRSQAQDDSSDQSILSMRSKPRNGNRRLDLVA